MKLCDSQLSELSKKIVRMLYGIEDLSTDDILDAKDVDILLESHFLDSKKASKYNEADASELIAQLRASDKSLRDLINAREQELERELNELTKERDAARSNYDQHMREIEVLQAKQIEMKAALKQCEMILADFEDSPTHERNVLDRVRQILS